MTAALPSNIHAELALDQGRLSRNGSERSGVRSVHHAESTAVDQHVRMQSQYGVIVETPRYSPSPNHGVIAEEPEAANGNGTLSGAELAAALDNEEEDDEDDITTERSVMHDAQWYEQRSPNQSFSPRQASMNNPLPQQQQAQSAGGTYPKSILQNRTQALSPPPRSSSCSVPPPVSAPAQQQAFPDRPRFALTDSGPISAPPSPSGPESEQGHPGIRRAVSDSHSHPHSAPNSPGLGVTPPTRRGPKTQPSTPTKYATFEEMGIQSKGANKDKEDCVIM